VWSVTHCVWSVTLCGLCDTLCVVCHTVCGLCDTVCGLCDTLYVVCHIVCGLCVRMLPNDSRASSLLRGSASRKLATDRDMHMTLWKNYVVMGCCVALPSHTANVVNTDYRCVTPELAAMLVCVSLFHIELRFYVPLAAMLVSLFYID